MKRKLIIKSGKKKISDELKVKILEVIDRTPEMTDKKFHKLAIDLGIDEHAAETFIYQELHKIRAGGMAKGMTIEDLAKRHKVTVQQIREELNKGVEVEKEHTEDLAFGAIIALDHLYEDAYYYTKLKKVNL